MAIQQPRWPRFLPSNVVVGCARLGPLGRLKPGPGTWGSVAGLLYFTVCFIPLGIAASVFLHLLGFYLAVALCGEAELRLQKRDPGEIVLDEFVAIPVCFLGWPVLTDVAPRWAIFLAGFALFRLFDIAKPFGIRWLQDLPGGWGVVLDDIAAALATCAVLHLCRLVWIGLQ